MLPHQVTMNELDADTAKAIVTKYFATLSLLQRSGRLAASDGDLPERPANIKAAIKFVYIFGAADEVASIEDSLRSAWLALARFLPSPEYARAHTIQEELALQTARIEASDPNLAKDGEALEDLLASTNELNALIANRADALRLEFGHLQAERSRFRELQRDAEGGTGERGNKSAMSGDPTQGADPTEKLLLFARRMQNFVREPPLAGAQVAVPEECADAARVIMFHWGRTFRTFQSITILVQSGLCEDAIVLLRTLMEIFIEVAFLAKRPEDARAYLEHGIRTEVEWWDRVARTAPADIRVRTGLDAALARLDLSEPTIQPARPKAGLKSAWHPKFASVKSRAKEAGVAP